MTLEQKINELRGILDQTDDRQKRVLLQERYDNVTQMQQDGAKDVQFVVVAMTRNEAVHLLDGKREIFQQKNTPEEYQRFQELKQQIDAQIDGNERDVWLAHYRTTREAWTPHIYKNSSAQTIVELIEEMTISQHKHLRHTFWPNFTDGNPDLFAADDAPRIAAWNSLERNYVLLIDGLSLFYPHIRKTLQSFAFKGTQDSAALIFSQCEAAIHPIDAKIEDEIAKQIPWLFGNFETFANPLYEIGVNHARRVKRWLCASVPQVMGPPSANPENRMPWPSYGMNPGGPRP